MNVRWLTIVIISCLFLIWTADALRRRPPNDNNPPLQRPPFINEEHPLPEVDSESDDSHDPHLNRDQTGDPSRPRPDRHPPNPPGHHPPDRHPPDHHPPENHPPHHDAPHQRSPNHREHIEAPSDKLDGDSIGHVDPNWRTLNRDTDRDNDWRRRSHRYSPYNDYRIRFWDFSGLYGNQNRHRHDFDHRNKAGLLNDQSPVNVTVDNFVRAQTDTMFQTILNSTGGLGLFSNSTETNQTQDGQPEPYLNVDTLSSSAIFDLSSPVTIFLPQPDHYRFMSVSVINQDHLTPITVYHPGAFTLTHQMVGTQYCLVVFKLSANPDSAEDMKAARELEDRLRVNQRDTGRFVIPNYDSASLATTRDHLAALFKQLPDTKSMMGTSMYNVDPIRHLLATAGAFGLASRQSVLSFNVKPDMNNGTTVYKLDVPPHVPADFWSVTVYDSTGHFEKDKEAKHTINSHSADENSDGSVDLQFGDCAAETTNCLPTSPDWSYTLRLYHPGRSILMGRWVFPSEEPVEAEEKKKS